MEKIKRQDTLTLPVLTTWRYSQMKMRNYNILEQLYMDVYLGLILKPAGQHF